tara:strand:- start:18 stop:149 length:132 start_codon:yes stop_codon:yes gene_type:complete
MAEDVIIIIYDIINPYSLKIKPFSKIIIVVGNGVKKNIKVIKM